MAILRPLLLVLALLVLPPSAPSAQAGPDGAAAPAGTWPTAGGPPSRSGLSLSRPLLGEPVEAWAFGPATFEGEPRVWGGRVFASLHEGGNRRSLLVLDLETGEVVTRQRQASEVPLEPSVWEERVAVRSGREVVQVFQLRASRLYGVRTIRAGAPVSAPLLFEDELYLRAGDALVRHDLDGQGPRWQVGDAGRFRGDPALFGDAVFACAYDPAGNAGVLEIDRASGRVLGRGRAGHHGGEVPAPSERLEVVVTDGDLFVRHERPVSSSANGRLTWVRLPRTAGGFGTGAASLHAFTSAPIAWARGWLVRERDEAGPRWASTRAVGDSLRSRTLAQGGTHRWLVDTEAAPSRTRELLYLGAAAVSSGDLDVRWRLPVRLAARPVPVDGGLLLQDGNHRRHIQRHYDAGNHADENPDPADRSALHEKDLDDVAWTHAKRSKNRDIGCLVRHHHDQARNNIECSDADD